MCTCSSHCTLSPHHEIACCNQAACGCECHGEIKVFLDDERETPPGWLRTYRVEDTLFWLGSRRVTHLSLDNDLGLGKREGYEVLDILEETIHFDSTFPVPEISIHSANASRVGYMKRATESIARIKRGQNV
jgi:hypothetical protein